MKTMTCNQLGGEEMSKNHGMEMFQKNDKDHLEAMNKMRAMMTTPDKMKEWFDQKRKEFEALPDNN